jgi:hypothetical protein
MPGAWRPVWHPRWHRGAPTLSLANGRVAVLHAPFPGSAILIQHTGVEVNHYRDASRKLLQGVSGLMPMVLGVDG